MPQDLASWIWWFFEKLIWIVLGVWLGKFLIEPKSAAFLANFSQKRRFESEVRKEKLKVELNRILSDQEARDYFFFYYHAVMTKYNRDILEGLLLGVLILVLAPSQPLPQIFILLIYIAVKYPSKDYSFYRDLKEALDKEWHSSMVKHVNDRSAEEGLRELEKHMIHKSLKSGEK